MSTDPNQPTGPDAPAADDAQTGTPAGGYSATDLPEGASPDPLGDASLTARERAGASDDGQ